MAATAGTDRDRAKKSVLTTRARRALIWGASALAALVILAGSLVYTEQSSFCKSCHEMDPYYEAWLTGPHANNAQCVDCHVDSGVIAHLAHKPIALKEVWDHFFSNNRFPTYTVELPNTRCEGCHTSIPEAKQGFLFSHAKHQARGLCKDCHSQTGHVVTLASLDAAGVLNSAVTTPTPVGMMPSSTPGHRTVVCQKCHDQARMKCSTCHQATHSERGECSNCHLPDGAFKFSHPIGSACVTCHKPPSPHFGGSCGSCHTPDVPFTDTVYRHAAGANCRTCHKPPANHYGTTCSLCHKPTVPFAQATFRHSAGANCASCHRPPSNHFGSSCSACHRPGVAFASATFRHPARTGAHSYRSFACVKCHPNGYTTSYCSCHKGNPPTGD